MVVGRPPQSRFEMTLAVAFGPSRELKWTGTAGTHLVLMDAPRIHHEAKTQSRWALSRQNRRSMGMSVEPEGGSNPRPADYEPAPLCVVGDLWCCLIPACTVVARCSCWAVTARDCQYRDSGYTTDARRQHQSVVVAQWTPPAVVDRHKGGELAYLAGDILQEAIEAARRGIRRVRRTPHLPGCPSRRTGPGLGTHMASVRAVLSTKRSGQPGEGDGPSGPPLPTWTCQLQGLLPGGSAPTGVKMPAPGPTMTKAAACRANAPP